MLITKFVLGLALASLAVIQVSAVLDPAIVAALANARAVVQTSSAAATSAANAALASITDSSAVLNAVSSVAYQSLLRSKVDSVVATLNAAIHDALPHGGGDNSCVNNQRAAVAVIPNKAANDFQACVNVIVNQVNAYRTDAVNQQSAAGALNSSAESVFTNCTLNTHAVYGAVHCIGLVGSFTADKATVIVDKVNGDVAAVDRIMMRLNTDLGQCAAGVWSWVQTQSNTIIQAINNC